MEGPPEIGSRTRVRVRARWGPSPASLRALPGVVVIVLLVSVPSPAHAGMALREGRSQGDTVRAPLPARGSEPVIARGERLGPARGRALAELALFAFHGDRWEPIPFQVDERMADGSFAFPGSLDGGPDEDPGLDANDELVFMASDAGSRTGEVPSGADLAVELEVEDPVTGDVGYVYLAAPGPGEAPLPRSDRRYVELDLATDSIRSERWNLAFSRQVPFSWAYAKLRGPDGRLGPSVIDGVRVQVEAVLFHGLVEWSVDEESVPSFRAGYLVGPVRVVRRVVAQLDYGLDLDTFDLVVDMTFYRDAWHLPALLSVPIRVGHVLSDVVLRVGVDMRNVDGWTLFANEQPGGVQVDGVMSPAEVVLGDDDVSWVGIVSDHGHGLVARPVLGEGLGALSRTLYYVDEPGAPGPPGTVAEPGPSLGIVFRAFDQLPAATHPLSIEFYLPRAYHPGDEASIFRNADRPLVVTARSLR